MELTYGKWMPINIDDISADEQKRKRAAVVELTPQFTPAMSIIKSWYGEFIFRVV